MAKSSSTETEDQETEEKPKKRKKITRDTELSEIEEHQEALMKMAGQVAEGYRAQISRVEDACDYWDIYECSLNDNQAYNGNSQAFIPFTADATDARKTRFGNQLFPVNNRNVEVVTEDGTLPHAEMALVEFYIRQSKLETEVIPALIVNGDVEGQYNLYVSWQSIPRHVVSRETVKEGESSEIVIKEEVIYEAGPKVECIPDADVSVQPATSDSIQEAISRGGHAAIARRWTKATIEKMIADGDLVKDQAELMITDMDAASSATDQGKRDMKKMHVADAGVKEKGKYYLAREAWHHLEVKGEQRLVRSYFGSDTRTLLGTKLCPYWCDLPPIISGPVKKLSGSFKGSSLYKRIASLQYASNDFLNEAMDSATYSMMPIVMTDPEKNPKSSTMILDLAAVWETSPNDTQFAKFPDLWKSGFELIASLKNQIQQTLGVNPAMIPSTSGRGKRSQADIANEQAVDILTTADAVTVIEGLLTPLIQRFVSYDMQFRNDDMLVPMFGMMGKRAKMERIPPIQMNKHYEFKWLGVEAARNAQQIQQQIAFINVLKGIPPQMYRNHRIDLTALLEGATENIFGPRLAPLTFVDMRDELSMDQDEENVMLVAGMPVPVSPMDNDQEHLKKLQPVLQAGDPSGYARIHAQDHMKQMQAKAMQAQQQAAQQMGAPEGGPPGQPREGAQPGQPRMQQPPGAVHQDQMPGAGAIPFPRKM